MNMQNIFKRFNYRKPPYTGKLGLRPHDCPKFDWLLEGYISRGGLVCLQSNVPDKALDWCLELGRFYTSLGPLFMGLDHECGDFLLVNNNLPANFLPERLADTDNEMPFWNVFDSHFFQTEEAVFHDLEKLVQKINKRRNALIVVTHMPLYLTAPGHESEGEIRNILGRLNEEAIANDATILAICPKEKNTPMLEKAAGYVAAVSQATLRLDWLHDSKGIYEFSVSQKFPQHEVKEPVYLVWDDIEKSYGILNTMMPLGPERDKRLTYTELEERRELARVLKFHGLDNNRIARIFGVHPSTIYKWTHENKWDKYPIPLSDTSGNQVLRFKGKIIFDGKFH